MNGDAIGSSAKRQRIQGASASASASSSTLAVHGSALRDAAEAMRRALGDAAAGDADVDEVRLSALRDEAIAAVDALIRRRGELAAGPRPECGGDLAALDAALDRMRDGLATSLAAAGAALDRATLFQSEALVHGVASPSDCKHVLASAHKLSYSAAAPPGYRPGDPRWGAVGPYVHPTGSATGFTHFSPPAPQKWHSDASVLFDLTAPAPAPSSQQGAGGAEGGVGAAEGAVDEEAGAFAVGVGSGRDGGEDPEQANGGALRAPAPAPAPADGDGGKVAEDGFGLDMILNPDFEVVAADDEEESSSSD